jgi:hypothetical protein
MLTLAICHYGNYKYRENINFIIQYNLYAKSHNLIMKLNNLVIKLSHLIS